VATPGNMARRVLVVDDETAICETIAGVLALDHHEVETVTSGHAALLAFQRSKFDLVIVDYLMPVMKGDEVAAALKALAPQQPILMMTAYNETLRLEGSFPLAVDLVIRKPFDVQEFREAVRQLAAKT
jgi:CheY-like chemotaxis protein